MRLSITNTVIYIFVFVSEQEIKSLQYLDQQYLLTVLPWIFTSPQMPDLTKKQNQQKFADILKQFLSSQWPNNQDQALLDKIIGSCLTINFIFLTFFIFFLQSTSKKKKKNKFY